MKTAVGLSALLVLLALVGCTPVPFPIEVTGSLEHPVLELKPRRGVLTGSLCLRTIQAVRDDPPTSPSVDPRPEVLWRAVARDGGCRRIGRLVYGEAIPDMETVVPPKALQAGVRYLVFGQAAGVASGFVVIVFEDGVWKVAFPRRGEGQDDDQEDCEGSRPRSS